MKDYVNLLNTLFDIMSEIINALIDKFCIMFAGVLSLIFTLTGGEDKFMKALIIIMIIDYITGLSRAIITKKLNSTVGHRGIIKKVMSICLIALAHQVDISFNSNDTFKSIVTKLLFSNECLSILENCSICGLPMPQKLKNLLEQYKKEMSK